MFLDLALKNLLHFIVIHKIIHIEMYNHPVNKIYFLLNTEKNVLFFPNIPQKDSFIFPRGSVPYFIYIEVFYYYYMLNETKKTKWT